MGRSMPSWRNFSNRWLCYEKNTSRNMKWRLINTTLLHGTSNSPALSSGKGKANKLPTANKNKQLTRQRRLGFSLCLEQEEEFLLP